MSYDPRWSLFERIFGGDSKVEIIDDGTAASVVTQLDNTQVATFTGDGFKLAEGGDSKRITEFSKDDDLGGHSGWGVI